MSAAKRLPSSTENPGAVIRRAVLDDWMWIRLAAFALCIIAAYLVWLAAWQHPRPGSEDILPIIALSFGAFGVLMGFLRWLSIPDPTIEFLSEHAIQIRPDLEPPIGVLHLKVTNNEVARWLRPLVQRLAPEGCIARIQYHHMASGQPLFGGSALVGRWNDNTQPINYETGRLDLVAMLKNRRLPKMYPCDPGDEGGPSTVAFLVKQSGSGDCHHFNDESYRPDLQPGWRNPEWRIAEGVYRVSVEITGYGLIHLARFQCKLVNTGNTIDRADFRLEPL